MLSYLLSHLGSCTKLGRFTNCVILVSQLPLALILHATAIDFFQFLLTSCPSHPEEIYPLELSLISKRMCAKIKSSSMQSKRPNLSNNKQYDAGREC